MALTNSVVGKNMPLIGQPIWKHLRTVIRASSDHFTIKVWWILGHSSAFLGMPHSFWRPSIGQVLASFWTNKPSDHSQAISDHSRTILGSFSDCSRTILGLSLDLFGPFMPIFGPKPKKQGHLRHAASFALPSGRVWRTKIEEQPKDSCPKSPNLP